MILKRMRAQDRRKSIIQGAVRASLDHGYNALTWRMVAEYSDISYATVRRYFGDLRSLRIAIMGEAIVQNIQEIIIVGVALRDPLALESDPDLSIDFIRGV